MTRDELAAALAEELGAFRRNYEQHTTAPWASSDFAVAILATGIFDQLLADAELGREWRLTEAALPDEDSYCAIRGGPLPESESWYVASVPSYYGDDDNAPEAGADTPAAALAALRERL
jgi:hypothetical protein